MCGRAERDAPASVGEDKPHNSDTVASVSVDRIANRILLIRIWRICMALQPTVSMNRSNVTSSVFQQILPSVSAGTSSPT